jgi:glycerate kinase
MRVLVVPGSYKGTLKSIEATELIANALSKALPDASITRFVLADGGEGTLEAFAAHFALEYEYCSARTPVGSPIDARYGFLPDQTAVIESSQAIGLSLLTPKERDPFRTSSAGVGDLIENAVRKGASHVLVTLGDSSTMDMGIGMLHALGVRFYSAAGEMATPGLDNLEEIVDFDDTQIRTIRETITFTGLADTDDYLCGDLGQVQLFGHQKGLADSQIATVESAYRHFADVIHRRIGVDETKIIRASGSGGLAAALHAFLNADLVNTLEFFSRTTDLHAQLRAADIVVTGEGCLDRQTRLGKVPYYVASRAPGKCLALVGSYTQQGLEDMKGACRELIISCINPATAMTNPAQALSEAAFSMFSLLR